ncbi:DUF4179 domain-containing protein [Shimazuella kribbensis]|uniref:DUF4179 domain-containing protein n=1 Tax=Shimazuella kribbensis TaxID=139808 RepID=UPI0003FDDD24|nr:DUF4179 domain-containing protein [Shimazuella kribbensis]
MKCISEELLLAYLDGECTAEENKKIDQHLSACADCQELLDEGVQEMMMLRDALEDKPFPAPLDFSFVESVRQEIQKESNHLIQNQPKKRRKWKKGIRIIAATAAILALIMGIAAYTSSAFATVLQNLYLTSPFVDSGTQSASQDGFTQVVYQGVTDKGYTLEVAEVMADANRIVVALRIRDQQGKYHTPMMNIDPSSRHTSNTASIINFWDQETASLFRTGSPTTSGFSQLEFETIQPLPEEAYLKLKVGLLEISTQSGTQKIKGKWNLTVPIDLKAAQSSRKTVQINKKSPVFDGVIFTLDQIGFTPSTTTVQYGIQVTETENKRMSKLVDMAQKEIDASGESKKSEVLFMIVNWVFSLFGQEIQTKHENALSFIRIKYRITDGKGKTLIESHAISSGRRISESNDPKLLNQVSEDSFSKALKRNKSYRFVLDKIIKRQLVDYDIPLLLDPLPKKPVTAKVNGKRFIIKRVGMNLVKSDKKDRYQIELYSDYPEPFSGEAENWVVTDETGKTYKTVRVGTGVDNPKQDLEQQILSIEGLNHHPKQLTLRLVDMDVIQKVDWVTEIKR